MYFLISMCWEWMLHKICIICVWDFFYICEAMWPSLGRVMWPSWVANPGMGISWVNSGRIGYNLSWEYRHESAWIHDVIKWKHFPRNWSFLWEFTGECPVQRPMTRSFDVFFDLRLNKRLSKQSWGWWFEIQSRSLWRHCNAIKRLRERKLG